MANDLTGQVWSVDSTATLSASKNRLKINAMWWVPSAASDNLVVKDGAGNTTIWDVTALTSGTAGTETFPQSVPIWTSGLSVTMSSIGTLYISVG